MRCTWTLPPYETGSHLQPLQVVVVKCLWTPARLQALPCASRHFGSLQLAAAAEVGKFMNSEAWMRSARNFNIFPRGASAALPTFCGSPQRQTAGTPQHLPQTHRLRQLVAMEATRLSREKIKSECKKLTFRAYGCQSLLTAGATKLFGRPTTTLRAYTHLLMARAASMIPGFYLRSGLQ